jgi:hypothetical protein
VRKPLVRPDVVVGRFWRPQNEKVRGRFK